MDALGQDGHRFDEPVPLPRHRLHEAGVGASLAERTPQLADHDVKTVVELDVLIRPEPVTDLFARDQFTRPLEQQAEQVDCLSGEPYASVSARERSTPIVELEFSERFHHGDGGLYGIGEALRDHNEGF
jgi:hypothetical protein